MTRFLFALLMALMAPLAVAAPFIVGDLADQTTTHCALELNGGAWGPDVPVAGTAPKECRFDIGNVAAGPHTVRAKAIKVDAVWGRQESPPSAPFSFTRPASPAPPAGIRLAQ